MIQLELETPLCKTLIEENGCSGEYAPAFTNNTIHVASLLKSITLYKALLNQPFEEGWANHTLRYISF